jgi:hypothetical protein
MYNQKKSNQQLVSRPSPESERFTSAAIGSSFYRKASWSTRGPVFNPDLFVYTFSPTSPAQTLKSSLDFAYLSSIRSSSAKFTLYPPTSPLFSVAPSPQLSTCVAFRDGHSLRRTHLRENSSHLSPGASLGRSRRRLSCATPQSAPTFPHPASAVVLESASPSFLKSASLLLSFSSRDLSALPTGNGAPKRAPVLSTYNEGSNACPPNDD